MKQHLIFMLSKVFFNGKTVFAFHKKTAYVTYYSFEKRLHFGIVYKVVGLQWSLKFIREKRRQRANSLYFLSLKCV